MSFEGLGELQKGWVVGILEGEGTFVLRRKAGITKERLNALVEVVNTDEDQYVLLTLQKLLGGKLYKAYRGKECKWALNKKDDVLPLLRSIKPYMSSRRANKIQEILDTYSERDGV